MQAMDFPGFKVIGAETSGNTLCVTIETLVDRSRCPTCGYDSHHLHSRYVRQLRDLPVSGRPVCLHAFVRRFRCLVRDCARKTFSESLGELAVPYAQRAERVTHLLRTLILSNSCNMSAFIASQFGIQTSPRTLLRVVETTSQDVLTPRVLGIDDFALRRGRTYGTILCDLETRKPIDILPGRTAAPLLQWLRQHPGVKVVARDRATAYADAVRSGAPEAIQVADRFHLVRNVSDALREVIDRQSWALPEPTPLPVSSVSTPVLAVDPAPNRPSRYERLRTAAAKRLKTRYTEVWRRHSGGESIRAIRRATGLSRSTIRKYLDSEAVPKRAVRRPVPRNLDPFVDYVGSRWRSGCHNAHRLYTEIVAIGYTGSESMLRKLVQPWRTHPQPSAAEHDSRVKRCIWKDVRWSVLRPQEQLRADEREYLKTFLALHPRLALAYDLVQRFRLMLHAHKVEEFDDWLATARASKLTPFERLGRTLSADRSAVMAAIELQWSTGQVEGQITRVKLLKRLGYGRASLPLLRARIIGL